MYKSTFWFFRKEIWLIFNSCFSLGMCLSPPAVKHKIKQLDADFMIIVYLHRPN